jgi:dTDP-4-dehydrorhamnose 3,5-epimerase-like enzyme
MKHLVTWLELTKHGDARGSLVSIENHRAIPFDIRRVYYIFDTLPGVSRGHHAHRNLKQLMVCISGHCHVTLDDGQRRETAHLNDPCRGLLIEGPIWREMDHFSPGCVLMVLASEPYDEADYIRDYAEFQTLVRADADHS